MKEQPGIGHQAAVVEVIWIRSGWLRGSIYWVLLFRGRFFATKPSSQIQRSPSGFFKGCPQGRPSVDGVRKAEGGMRELQGK